MDFDGDGQADIISGSYMPGNLYLFHGRADGTFAKGEFINGADGNPINVGSASHVFAADFDGRGVLDLVIGNIDGSVYLVVNTGSRDHPVFAQPRSLNANGKRIKVQGDAGPTLADWDGDGTLDLIIGDNSGAVYLYVNHSRFRTPDFAEARTLIKQTRQTYEAPGKVGDMMPASRSKPTVADFNGDGRLDLLVGDVSYAVREAPDAPKAAPAPTTAPTTNAAGAQERLRSLLKQYQTESARLRALPSDASADERQKLEWRVAELLNQVKAAHHDATIARRAQLEEQARRRSTGSPQIHGYVWFFERKKSE